MVRALVAGCMALLLLGCGGEETRFTLEAAQAGPRVQASGETAIPDGAQLNVSLEAAAGGDPLVVALPKVKGGRWEATLDPLKPLAAGDYVVRASFSPRAFAWGAEVKPFVGDNGEKLAGPNVKQGEGYRYLELTRPVALR